MKRKLLTIILAFTIILTMTSCARKHNGPDTPNSDRDTPNTPPVEENNQPSDDKPNDNTPAVPDKNQGDRENTGDKPSGNKNDNKTEARLGCGEVSVIAAAKLYNENDGNYVIHEITSMNSMYIVENGNTISSLRDLEGKTVYTEYGNDMGIFALEYLLDNIGILDTVTITEKDDDWMEEKIERGEEIICLADLDTTIELMEESRSTNAQINIAEEWKNLTGCRLYENCIVSERDSTWDRKVNEEIRDWEEDVRELKRDADKLNLSYDECTVSGEYDMMDELTDFFMTIYKLDPDVIGGSIPDDAFYSMS